jgi:ribose 5-phosphate isomerase B
MTREHNDSNVLCLGERVVGKGLALDIVNTWLKTEFSNEERHKNRIALIDKIEKERL